jgi:hypothetical protein
MSIVQSLAAGVEQARQRIKSYADGPPQAAQG